MSASAETLPVNPLRRWLLFNGVGLLGACVQLATVWLLVRNHTRPALATALAVESAVLHNFFWHCRLTWRDRPALTRVQVVRRMLRFHVGNGAVSIAGNVLVAALLTRAGIHVVSANLISIVLCSLVNYSLGDRWVFDASGPS